MKYHTLGRSPLKVSEVAFGCMSLGMDDAANEKLIHRALNEGINFFDTADLYDKGFNESSLGKALKGKREKAVIATKVGNQWRADGSGWDWNPRKEYIIACVEKSLQRLQTDRIDLYQLHGGTIDDPIDETIGAFELLQQQGKILYYGISSIRPNVIREYAKRSNIVTVMMQYSLLDRRPEVSCFGVLQQHGIGVLARGSLAKGILVNKPAVAYLDYSEAEVQKAKDTIAAVSGAERNPAQTALKYALMHPVVSSAVTGIRTMEQLLELAKETPRLNEMEYEQLTAAVPVKDYTQHV
ncbi:aldo/keto reductase [Chitinophaga sp. GCM10012297]|uniref:Aldo/keto reductase n=1 Tax=Chitinophaga chungangae TaxID=2821488 RepID=A0ABS3Y971_9BACT|nr:aldo/keto reductase [Chitinophaga chungangae]MBO9151219.1 aldo/keto reductase [Chitinophaga chungangae]